MHFKGLTIVVMARNWSAGHANTNKLTSFIGNANADDIATGCCVVAVPTRDTFLCHAL